jgi:hypothetical protein
MIYQKKGKIPNKPTIVLFFLRVKESDINPTKVQEGTKKKRN